MSIYTVSFLGNPHVCVQDVRATNSVATLSERCAEAHARREYLSPSPTRSSGSLSLVLTDPSDRRSLRSAR
jgi:hypothetical protein